MAVRLMQPSRRKVLQGAAGLAGLWTLAGCGAGGSTSGGSSAPALGDSTETFLRQAGRKVGTSKVTVLAFASPQADAIRKLTGQFTDMTGIAVDWTSLDEQSASNKAAVALGSGSGGYDIVQTTSNQIPIYVQRNWLASLDKLSRDTASTVPAWDRSVYGSGTTNLLSRSGSLYAAPMFLGTQIFYYRTDIFRQKGITRPPSSLTELRSVCEKVHGGGVSAIALRSAPAVSQLMFVFSAWLYSMGGKYYDTYRDGTYRGVALDSPQSVAALTLYSELLQKYAPTGATNWSVEDVVRSFASGQVAMTQEGAVFGGTFNDKDSSQVAGKVATFTIPGGTAGSFVPFAAHGWGVADNSQRKQAAWLFAQWATLPQTLTAATQNSVGFSTPPLASVYKSSAFQKRYGFDHYVSSITGTIEAADSGGVSPLKGDPSYLPGTPKWDSLGQHVSEQFSRALTGQLSARKAITAAARAMDA